VPWWQKIILYKAEAVLERYLILKAIKQNLCFLIFPQKKPSWLRGEK
jgi:hypothetical protein